MERKKDNYPRNEYDMIQEKIVPKKKMRIRIIVHFIGKTILFAALFGVIAGGIFAATERFLMKHWGLEGTLSQYLNANRQNPSKTEGGTNPGNVTPGGTDNSLSQLPQITVELGERPASGEDGKTGDTELPAIRQYYAGIAKLAGIADDSLVWISAITEGVDWFEETYETKKSATGLYVGSTEQEMLFLVNLDSIEGATKLEIRFSDGNVFPGNIYTYDTNYRLAIVAVPYSVLQGEKEENLPKAAVILQEDVLGGTPVFVLGNPNQHESGIEVGMVTGAFRETQVVDDAITYFTTNITRYASGDGFVFDLEGRVVGILSTSLNNGEQEVFCAASFGRIFDEIERLLNKKSRVFCGLYVETVSEDVKNRYRLPDGVYISEVQTSSPALSAGLKVGDIIVKMNDQKIRTVEDFHHALNAVSGGKDYWITVSRETGGERKVQRIPVALEYRAH